MVTLIDLEVIDTVFNHIMTGKVVFCVTHERAVQTFLQKSCQGGYFNDKEVALVNCILDAMESNSCDDRASTGARQQTG